MILNGLGFLQEVAIQNVFNLNNLNIVVVLKDFGTFEKVVVKVLDFSNINGKIDNFKVEKDRNKVSQIWVIDFISKENLSLNDFAEIRISLLDFKEILNEVAHLFSITTNLGANFLNIVFEELLKEVEVGVRDEIGTVNVVNSSISVLVHNELVSEKRIYILFSIIFRISGENGNVGNFNDVQQAVNGVGFSRDLFVVNYVGMDKVNRIVVIVDVIIVWKIDLNYLNFSFIDTD